MQPQQPQQPQVIGNDSHGQYDPNQLPDAPGQTNTPVSTPNSKLSNDYSWKGSGGGYNSDGTISQQAIPQQAQDIQSQLDAKAQHRADFWRKLSKKKG